MLDQKIIFITIISFFFYLLNIQGQNIDVEKEIETIIEMRDHDIEKTIKYTDSLLQYDFPNKVKIKIEKGLLYISSNEPKKSILIFKNVIKEIKNDEKKLRDLGNAYVGISQSYSLTGNNDDALKNIFKGLQIGKKLKDIEFESRIFSVMAYLYYNSKDYKNALKYEKESVKILNKIGDYSEKDESLYGSYMNIAVYFQKMHQLDSALYYNNKVILTNKKTNIMINTATLLNNIAVIYKKQKKYNKAIEHYKKSINAHQKRKSNSTRPLANLARLYINLKKYDSAKVYYLEALNIAITSHNLKNQEQLYSSLLNTAIKQKDYKNSLLYQQKRDSINQINLTESNKNQLKMLNTQFEQHKQEEYLKQKLALNKKNNIIIFITSGLLFFISLFFLQKYKHKQLKLNQDKLVLEQKVLRSQMTPHFIFNSLSVLQGMILNKEENKAVSYLSKFSKLLRITLDNSREKLVSLNEELIAIQNYVDLNNMRTLIGFNYILKIDNNIDVNNFLVPPMLIQPFIENSIIHGFNKDFENGEIIVDISFKNKILICQIKDNGIGINYNKKTTNKKSLSTTITLERLRFFAKEYGVKCDLVIQDRSIFNEKGTLITLHLPYKKHSNA